MKEGIKNRISNILLFILSVLLLWMLVVVVFSMMNHEGLLNVVQDMTCEKIKIGKTESGRDVYSYCLEKVNLEKVQTRNGKISDSLLMKNLKEKSCLYDGGTCNYTSQEYQIIFCMQNDKNRDIIITTKEKDFEELYHQFCEMEEILK